MTPPSSGPGALVIVLAIVASVAAIVFVGYVLGGWRLVGRDDPSLKHALVLVGVLVVTAGGFLLAVRYEGEQRETAWEQYYDHQDQQQETTEEP